MEKLFKRLIDWNNNENRKPLPVLSSNNNEFVDCVYKKIKIMFRVFTNKNKIVLWILKKIIMI